MDNLLCLRPFVPAKDYARSVKFYQALGFVASHEDAHVTIFTMGSFGFILQNFYNQVLAENFMLQLMVRDVDAWWGTVDFDALAAEFGVKKPLPPVMQHWGLKVGFIFDPSGVLWHVAEFPPAE